MPPPVRLPLRSSWNALTARCPTWATVLEGRLPRKADAVVAKNFLFKDELYVLHLMCEQFLLFAESKALRGQALTMKELTLKLDQLFAINKYPVFNGYGDFLRA